MGVAVGIDFIGIGSTPAPTGGDAETEGIILLAKSDLEASVGIVGGAPNGSEDPMPSRDGGEIIPPDKDG